MIERVRPSALLAAFEHRSTPLPLGRWNFYQEWHDALFLHYQVDPAALRSLVPQELKLDFFEGKAWISVVAFTMQNVRPRWLPGWSAVSDFHEVNLRTYVRDRNGIAGVYFLSIDAAKWVSVALARLLSTLPYRKAQITRRQHAGNWFEASTGMGMHLQVNCRGTEPITCPMELDRWLVERYALFECYRDSVWCYEIHHLPWPLQMLRIDQLLLTPAADITLFEFPDEPDLAHWSAGVQILSWPRSKIIR